MNEPRRIGADVAKLPELLKKGDNNLRVMVFDELTTIALQSAVNDWLNGNENIILYQSNLVIRDTDGVQRVVMVVWYRPAD